MSFVFVSHAAPDKQTRVRPLVQALAIEGVLLWLDRPGSGPNDFQLPPDFISRHQIRSLRLGQDWDEGIKSALRDAGAVLICLSKAALEPGREVLRQEMWGAQLTRKAVSCIVDDLDLASAPQEHGLLSLAKSQSLRIDTETLGLAVDWLSADGARTPDQLPRIFQLVWQDVRRLRDELQMAREDAQAASLPPQTGRYRWPVPWDFSAYMADKRETFEGRDWLFEEISHWQAAGTSRAMLIRADFGVGKSAIMAELVHRNPGGCIAAWHFCQHDTQETLHPGAYVRSLAAQLAATIPGYKAAVDADQALQERLDRALIDPGSAFEGAILGPLAHLPMPAAPRLVLIDALDEALEVGNADLRAIGSIVSLLAAKAGRFPRWLRVLATSRPNPQVLTPLSAFGTREIDAESTGNHDDLRCYIVGRCVREPLASVLQREGVAAEPLAESLVKRSQGKFLYAVRALRDLENGHIDLAALEALPPGMDSFYHDAFDRRFARAGRPYDAARSVLGVLAVAREPLSAATLATVIDVAEPDVKAVHRALPDFLRQRAGRLSFDHFSMAEWLTRETDDGFARAGDYAVDAGAAHAAIRRWALQQVEQGVAHRSDYLLRHLSAHLNGPDERRRVYAALMLERFEWLQARLDQSGVDALIADAQALEGLPAQPLLLALLRNGAHVVRRFPTQLAAQVLGRLGDMSADHGMLAELCRSALRWLGEVGPDVRHSLLQPTGRSLRLSTGQQATLVGGGFSLALLPDGRIASGCKDGTVQVWDIERPAEPLVFSVHSAKVTALAVLNDGRLASAGSDATVCVWDLTGLAEPVTFAAQSFVASALAALPDGRVAAGYGDGAILLWNPKRPDAPVIRLGHEEDDEITQLRVLPDGRLLSLCRNGHLRLWDPEEQDDPLLIGDGSWGTAMAVLPDGRIAWASGSGLALWGLDQPIEQHFFDEHVHGMSASVGLPDGRIAMGFSDGTLRLWDPVRPALLVALGRHAGSVADVVVLPDGRIASAARDGTVRLWDSAAVATSTNFDGHGRDVTALAALHDGRVASGSYDGTIRLWHPERPSEPTVLEVDSSGLTALTVLPDGRLVVGSAEGRVRLWAANDSNEDLIYSAEDDEAITALTVLPDGRIAWTTSNFVLRVSSPASGCQPTIFDQAVAPPLAVLPDGRIASVVPYSGTIYLWDPSSLETRVFEGHSGPVTVLAALSDGRLVSGAEDTTLRIWNPANPSDCRILQGHSRAVTALAALRSGQIVAASDDHTVRLWNPPYSGEAAVFRGHSDRITAVAERPDGTIATGARDDTLRIWDPSGKRRDRLFVADSDIACILPCANGLVVAGCADGAVHFLQEVP
jgi:WD40 repeat protein